MSGVELTVQEARAIHDTIHPTLGFLTQLAEQLAHLQFGPNDNYHLLVTAARDGVHALAVETHYQSCESGVWRSPRL